jgi:hypothetical protein
MPRHLAPMKDVGGCEKPRGAADQALIRGCPNGETQHREVLLRSEHIGPVEGTGGTETSKYPEEKKAIATPLVVASEKGSAQTDLVESPVALPGRGRGTDTHHTGDGTELQNCYLAEVHWNDTPQKVRVLYAKGTQSRVVFPSSAGSEKAGVN